MSAHVTLDDFNRQQRSQVRRIRAYRREEEDLPQLPVRHFDNAYVAIDSLDAGRTWNQTPPSMGQVGSVADLDCLPPGEDRSLGQFAAVAAVIAPVVGAAFQAGGAVGAAMISADAQKYAVRQQTKADMTIALARAKSELEMTKVTVESNVEIAKETTKQKQVEVEGSTQQTKDVSMSLVPIVGLLGAGAIAAWILTKD